MRPLERGLLIAVVDDDASISESLPDLLRQLGFEAQAFRSAEQFLASSAVDRTRCLILDMALPGQSGPELQRELLLRRPSLPIVFITAHGNEAIRQRVLGRGAAGYLLKPFDETEMLAAINAAIGLEPDGANGETP